MFPRTVGCIAVGLLLLSSARAQCPPGDLFDPLGSDYAYYGGSVDLEGPWALVGASFDDKGGLDAGAAFLYEQTASGWILRNTWLGQSGDRLGTSVQLDNGRAALASPKQGGNGRISVYTGQGPSWQLEQILEPGAGIDSGDLFGISMALQGDVLVVGAPFASSPFTAWGAAQVYRHSNGVWNTDALLPTAPTASGRQFGMSVALDGGWIAVGCPGCDVNGTYFGGGAYLYSYQGSQWIQATALGASSLDDGQFGSRVALSGQRLAVSIPFEDGVESKQGAVHIFEESGGLWTWTEQLTASPPIAGQNFGYRLDLEGDDLVAAWHDDLQGYKAGAVTHMHADASGTWQVQATHRHPHGNPGALFGSSLDIDAGQLLVSAPIAQSEAERRGAVFLRDLSQPAPRVWALPICFGDTTCRCYPTAQFQRTVGCPNGVGNGANLDACGSPSLSSDDLGFSASGLPPLSLALLLMGSPQAALPFNDGILCAAQTGVVFMVQATLEGRVVFPAGTLGQAATLLGPAYSAQAGQTWAFQVAYTDPNPPACLGTMLQLLPARVNQTPALVITIAP